MNAPELAINNNSIKFESSDSTAPLKIALLGYRSHPHVGGQGIYLRYLSRALKALGHHVDVFSGPPYPELDDNIGLIKVPSLDLYAHENHVTALRWKHLKSFTDTYEWWTMLTGGFGEPYTFGRRLLRDFKRQLLDYDIIHDNQSLCSALLQFQKKQPVVATIHHPITRDRELAIAAAPNWQYRLLTKRWYQFLNMQTRVAKRLRHITSVSSCSKKDIIEAFRCSPQHIHVIPNGIDTTQFRPDKSIPKEPYRLITTASSDQPLKGLSVLLKALNIVAKKYPDVRLTIIGKLSADSANMNLLRNLNLEEYIEFKSQLSSDELKDEYNRATLCLCPSLYEGFGLPAGEAMSCGTAVISSDGGALPEVVGDAGVIIPAGDTQALANAVVSLFNDRGEIHRLEMAGRQHILDNFCWQKVAKQLTQYYHSMIAQINKPRITNSHL